MTFIKTVLCILAFSVSCSVFFLVTNNPTWPDVPPPQSFLWLPYLKVMLGAPHLVDVIILPLLAQHSLAQLGAQTARHAN